MKPTVTYLCDRQLRTEYGTWTETLFYDGQYECISLTMGNLAAEPVLCRVHSYCRAAHELLSVECDCLDQMRVAQSHIASVGTGIVVVLPQDGRGFGHHLSIVADLVSDQEDITQSDAYYQLTGRSDARDFSSAASILAHHHISEVNLISNNPQKEESLSHHGIKVASTVSAIVDNDLGDRPELKRLYEDKRRRGHNI